MASVTSYFNSTLYRKTMSRCWPLWALWGVGWLFPVPLNLLNTYFQTLRWSDGALETAQGELLGLAAYLPNLLSAGVWLAAGCAILTAMAVFGYLYNSRSACMMHALPLRREGLFITQYLAGLSALLLPLAAVGLLTLALELILLPSQVWQYALPALGSLVAGMAGICLFFFSFAAFCAMFTGHILALPAFYGILNGLVAVVYYLVSALMDEFFFGFTMRSMPTWVEYFTPVWALGEACRTGVRTEVEWTPGQFVGLETLRSPGTIAAYAAVGAVFALLALAVYRRRHVETAGDVVSVAVVRPLFKYGVAACSGLALGTFTSAFFLGWSSERGEFPLSLVVCVLLWTAAGYFVAEMLLKKSFRVWRGGWKGCAAAVTAMALLCAAFTFDLFGVESRVPDPDDVASVSLSSGVSYPSDSGTLHLNAAADPELISWMTRLHQAVVDDRERVQREYGDESVYLSLDYTLKNGSTLSRHYSVPLYKDELDREGTPTWTLNQLLQDRALVETLYGFDWCEEGRLVEVLLSSLYDRERDEYTDLYLEQSTAQLMELWQAVRQDFDAGTIGVRYLFDDREREENTCRTDLTFYWEAETAQDAPGSYSYSVDRGRWNRELTITLTPSAANTLAWLEAHDVLGEELQIPSWWEVRTGDLSK